MSFKQWTEDHQALWEFILFNVLSNVSTIARFVVTWVGTAITGGAGTVVVFLAELIAQVGRLFFPMYTGITDPEELEGYMQRLQLLYAFNVVFIIVAGGATGRAFADTIVENVLRKVVVPNAEAIKTLLQTM
jgi:hypothetical protein